jgi:hypothetical protein
MPWSRAQWFPLITELNREFHSYGRVKLARWGDESLSVKDRAEFSRDRLSRCGQRRFQINQSLCMVTDSCLIPEKIIAAATGFRSRKR